MHVSMCKGSLFADRNNDDFRQDSTIHNHQRGFNKATPANPMLAQEAINSKLSNALSRSITFPYICMLCVFDKVYK